MSIGERMRELLDKWIKNPKVVQGKWIPANERQADGRLDRATKE